MHSSTFEYLKPTDQQIADMAKVRQAAKEYCDILEASSRMVRIKHSSSETTGPTPCGRMCR
jgi:hypothetical protein